MWQIKPAPTWKAWWRTKLYLWQGKLALSLFPTILQRVERRVFVLASHADVLRDTRATLKIRHPQRQRWLLGSWDSTLVILYFSVYSCIRQWGDGGEHPPPATHQSSDPLSSQATAQAQRLPWLAKQCIKHTHTFMTSAPWPLRSQTTAHTHADTNTQTYTLWHFPVKRTSVHSPSHHHHHNQRSFVERQRWGEGHLVVGGH